MITKNYIRIFTLYTLLTTASLSVANWRDYIPNFGIQSHLFSLASSANKYVIAGTALFATGTTGYLLYRHKTRKNFNITDYPTYDEQKKDYERYYETLEPEIQEKLQPIKIFKHAVNQLADLQETEYENYGITIAKHLQTIARYSHRADVQGSDEFIKLRAMTEKLSVFIKHCDEHKNVGQFPYAASKEKANTSDPLWYWDNVKATIALNFFEIKIKEDQNTNQFNLNLLIEHLHPDDLQKCFQSKQEVDVKIAEFQKLQSNIFSSAHWLPYTNGYQFRIDKLEEIKSHIEE